jgi:CheY-like chemotaxis protein
MPQITDVTTDVPDKQDPERTKFLIALDDDPDSAELVARVGRLCGYESRALSDPHAIGPAFKERCPDVLTLDLSMPQKDGFQMLSLLQEVGFKGALIVISGNEDWVRQFACELAGLKGIAMATHLQKPVDIRTLKDLLKVVQLVVQ